MVILTDCKAVADNAADYLENFRKRTTNDPLWDCIYNLLDATRGSVRVKWIPSHLGDDKEKRQKYLEEGITTPEHIKGNDIANVLAKEGARQHDAHILDILVAKVRGSRD